MKTVFKFFLIGFAGIILSSCQDVIQIKLDEGSKLYVIDAFLNDLRQPQVVRVLSNDSYFSNREAPPITNAAVVLKDLSTNAQYTFTYTDHGNYVFNLAPTDTIAKINHQYELNVTIDGVVYKALATQKRSATIDTITTRFEDVNGGFGTPLTAWSCTMQARDKVDASTDYYWVKTFRNDTAFSAAGDLNVCIDGTGGAIEDADGKDSVPFTPPATLLSFKQYASGNKCRVEIHSVSRETYFFLLQAVAQINNGGLFATTPENVRTNIKTPSDAKIKGVGWFNMATVNTKSLIIPNQ